MKSHNDINIKCIDINKNWDDINKNRNEINIFIYLMMLFIDFIALFIHFIEVYIILIFGTIRFHTIDSKSPMHSETCFCSSSLHRFFVEEPPLDWPHEVNGVCVTLPIV